MKKDKLNINEKYLKRYTKKWRKNATRASDAFMNVFTRHHKNTPFEMKLCCDGTMLFEATKAVHEGHIFELAVALLTVGRFIHVNVGTEGLKCGSTSFYKSLEAI